MKNSIIYLLFFALSSISYGQHVTDFKKAYSVKELKNENDVAISQNSQYYILKAPYIKVAELAKNEYLQLVKRLSSSLFIIKVEKKITAKILLHANYLAIANNEWKLSDRLNNFLVNKHLPVTISVVGSSKKDLQQVLSNLKSSSFTLLRTYNNAAILRVTSKDVIEKIQYSDGITYIDLATTNVHEESVLSDHNLSINRVNKVHSDFPEINGEGLTISIKEDLFDESDLDILGRSVVSGLESTVVSSHATDMATIIGGAGNSFITGKGAAIATQFTSSNFENIFPDDDDIFKNVGISVQNHSYGTALPDNHYGTEAMLYDRNTNYNLELLHVFSAGNIGNQSALEGVYKNIVGYANISGSFKMAKNVLLVNAANEFGVVDERNSAGPTYDGRLKPEVVAYGKKGTSESAAIVSGIALLLQQVYSNNTGILPSSTLVKAALIAGADDAGALGIDFITGYGSVNAAKSMDIINGFQYFTGEVEESQELTFTISIPSNVHEIKIALSWNDPAANVDDIVALVNDLDMKVINTITSEEWLPWVLNHTPDEIALAEPATRQQDHLNNVEYITIDIPTPGTYTISVSANGLFTNTQQFDVAYNWNYIDQFEWTYPTSNDILNSDESHALLWDTASDSFSDVELSVNGGSWSTILSNVDLSEGRAEWFSNENPVKAQLRVTINGQFIESDQFIISPLIDHSVGFNCDNQFMLQWNKIEGIDSYNIYNPGNKYMELIETSTDTLVVLDKSDYPQFNYAVSPVWMGIEGNKSLAFDYDNQGVNCYYRNFLVSNRDNEYVTIELNISAIYNVDKIIFDKHFYGLNFIEVANITPIVNQLKYTFNDYDPLENFSSYRARIILQDGTEIEVDELEVFFPTLEAMTFYPNPIEQLDFFTLLSKGDGALLQMIDLTGTIVTQWEVNSNISHHALPNVLKGIYLLRMVRGETVFSRKRIVVY